MKLKRNLMLFIGLVGMALFLAGCPGKMMSDAPAEQVPSHYIG